MSLKETVIELKNGKRIYGLLVDRGTENIQMLEYICNNRLKNAQEQELENLIECLPLEEVKSIDINLK
jgi:hypothetical protein